MQVRKKTSSENSTMSFDGGGKYPGWRKDRRKARRAKRKKRKLERKLSRGCRGGSCFAY